MQELGDSSRGKAVVVPPGEPAGRTGVSHSWGVPPAAAQAAPARGEADGGTLD